MALVYILVEFFFVLPSKGKSNKTTLIWIWSFFWYITVSAGIVLLFNVGKTWQYITGFIIFAIIFKLV